MPIVLTAKLNGSETIQYFHEPLAAFYLRQASIHASTAAESVEVETKFKESLLAIIFSSMCLEAFANEMAENKLIGDELEDFIRLRNKYKIKGKTTGVALKIKRLFTLQWSVDLSLQHSPLREVNNLFRLRNDLVHYKITKTAGKAYMPSSESRTIGGKHIITKIDLTKEPTRTELPIIAKINEREAANSYNAALRIVKKWNTEAGAPPDALAGFNECDVA